MKIGKLYLPIGFWVILIAIAGGIFIRTSPFKLAVFCLVVWIMLGIAAIHRACREKQSVTQQLTAAGKLILGILGGIYGPFAYRLF